MNTYRKMFILAAILMVVGGGRNKLWGQEKAPTSAVLHIQQTQTVVPINVVPTFLATYHVLDGAKSPANLLALKGTLSMRNDSQNFSQVLWVLVYWKGECPAHDINLSQIAGYLWLDITKNPAQSDNSFPVDLVFPNPIPATGCIGFYYGGGPQFAGKTTMTADLELTYQAASSPNPNTVVSAGAGEYCFGQNFFCQNATAIDGEAFAVPTQLNTAGHLLEIYGNFSDSTLDGTSNYGPLPTGTWGAINDFYLLPGGCGIFSTNLNSQGFPNPAPLATLYSWLPKDALHLASVPQVDRVPSGQTSVVALQSQIQAIFPVPVKTNAGDCLVTIYGRTGNGATDNETQVNALLAP